MINKLHVGKSTLSMFVRKTMPDSGEAGIQIMTRAELAVLAMMAEFNLPLSTMDKFTKVIGSQDCFFGQCY